MVARSGSVLKEDTMTLSPTQACLEGTCGGCRNCAEDIDADQIDADMEDAAARQIDAEANP
jgi:hypothetical protein